MGRIILFIVFLSLGIGVVYGFTRYNEKPQTVNTKAETPQTVSYDSFSVEPAPRETKEGRVATFSGTVLHEPRKATELLPMTTLQPVKQAEKFVTKDDATLSIIFENIGSLNVGPQSEITFNQLLPTEFVISQKGGEVTYLNKGATPFSVRTSHLLISVQNAEANIKYDEENGTIYIKMIDGIGKVSYIDLENSTIIDEIPSHSTYTYTIETREGSVD